MSYLDSGKIEEAETGFTCFGSEFLTMKKDWICQTVTKRKIVCYLEEKNVYTSRCGAFLNINSGQMPDLSSMSTFTI